VNGWREALERYVHQRLPSADGVRITAVRGMPAGASNDTAMLDLEIACDGRQLPLRLVLRPQRAAGILAPYDVARQFEIMRALKRTAVPVPAAYWLERDAAIIGTPFFFMEWVRGQTLPLFWYGGRSPRLWACAEALAAIHAVDWEGAGLGFLAGGGPRSAIAGELSGWRARAEAQGLGSHPVLVGLGEYLVRNEPGDARRALLHGDPNPGNYLLEGDRVAAVVDWELAAIGDPRSDLGFYAALLTVFGGMPGPSGETVLSQAYEEVTGTPLYSLEYYEALGLYKMAIVLAGWGRRGNAWAGYYGLDAISSRLETLLGRWWAG
jgi:aminoglycoside phosphotransferase (APT) family kinase protein